MNRVNCEGVLLAAMAVADGEKPLIPVAELELHLMQCDHCRSEVEQLKAVMDLLSAQRRRERTESVWGQVAEKLSQEDEVRTASDHWPWFLLLGLAFAAYRSAVVASDWEPGAWFKLVPVLLAVAVFVLLRENPFKVNPELQVRTTGLRGEL